MITVTSTTQHFIVLQFGYTITKSIYRRYKSTDLLTFTTTLYTAWPQMRENLTALVCLCHAL